MAGKEPVRSHTYQRPRRHKRQARRCSAHRTNGQPCKGWAMLGQNVCSKHGGSAPQSVDAAKRRLLAAADPLMADLIALARNEKLDPSVRLRAIADALDRAGLSAKQSVELTLAPWQEAIHDLIGDETDFMIVNGEVEEPPNGPDWVPGDDPGDADISDKALTRDSTDRRQDVRGFNSDRLQRTRGAHHDPPPPRSSAPRSVRTRRGTG